MADPPTYPSDVAFTPAVKSIQSSKGSRRIYEKLEKGGGWRTDVTPELKAFIEKQRSV